MIDRRRFLPPLLMVGALALLALWYRSLEWETKQVDLGPTQEARQNPVLALQRLLEAREVPVTLVRGFGTLERLELNNTPIGSRDTLVLLNAGRSLRESQVESLWHWMEDGGRLLVTADNPYFDMEDLGDPLLDRLGLSLNYDYWDLLEEDDEDSSGEAGTEEQASDENETRADQTPTETEAQPESAAEETDPPQKDSAPPKESVPPKEKCDWDHVTLPVQLPDHPEDNLAMEFGSGLSFVAEEPVGRVLAAYETQIFLLREQVGAGSIHLLPSLEPLENDTIHCADNAFVLWQLLKDSDHVWLALNADSPSFWLYLWRFSALGCALLLAALAVWLWYRVPRFGPVLEPHTLERRQFMDHIHASAQFILRHQGNSDLVETLREELWLHLRLRHPGLERLDPAAQVERIGQFSGMATADVHLALFRALPVPAPDFVEIVQRLQHLRNAL